MAETILKTKLYIPPGPSPFRTVPRPRLSRRLDEALQQGPGVTLVTAPPGSGKTTLLSEWIKVRQKNDAPASKTPPPESDSPKFAWLSLDASDNDPTRFWRHVIAALETAEAGLGAEALTLLNSPQASPIETTLTTLLNVLSGVKRQLVLILDDYHLIENEAIHQAVAFFIDYMPPLVHLILTSRATPPIPLTRLRVQGRLLALTDQDLRFTREETATYLNQTMGLALNAEDIARLEARTEGWVAGLQLAALAGQGRDIARSLSGGHRYITDYLVEEVLSQQPEQIQTFLLHTSILERMCGPLCDAVLAQQVDEPQSFNDYPSPSRETLEWLEAANLFLVPLDNERHWYRYHHLFAEFLQTRLRQAVGAAQVADLHRRASAWHAAHDLPEEAVFHALAAGDIALAIPPIEEMTLPLLLRGEYATLENWLKTLPETAVRSRPRLGLGWAWIKLVTGRRTEVEPVLEVVVANLTGQPDDKMLEMRGELAAIRAMLLGFQGDYVQVIELCRQALEQLPADNHPVRSLITMNLGIAYERTNNLAQATQTLERAVAMSQFSGENLITALTALNSLANIRVEQGHLHQAADVHRQALQLATRDGQRSPSPITGRAYLGLADLYRKWNALQKAIDCVEIGLSLGQQSQNQSLLQMGNIILARILQARGDEVGAREAIEKAVAVTPASSIRAAWVAAIRARLALAQGDLTAASRWEQSHKLPLGHTFDYTTFPGEYATLARLFIAQERFAEANDLLERMLAAAGAAGRTGRVAEIVMLQALSLFRQGQRDQALAPLSRALSLTAAENYMRLFVDEGRSMAELLRFAANRAATPHQAFVTHLLETFSSDLNPQAQPHTSLTVEPLSERELEVLRLLARGQTNREIAETLFITVGTAKSHLNHIYRKLEVRSRTQAVARATELGLL